MQPDTVVEIVVGGESLSDATLHASCCGVDLANRPGRVRLDETAGLAEWTVVSGQVSLRFADCAAKSGRR